MEKSFKVLSLPGWQNAGEKHWLRLWGNKYHDEIVEQEEWMLPIRDVWIDRLEFVVSKQDKPIILVAHSLGCMLIAGWAEKSKNTDKVIGALLVAPADSERAGGVKEKLGNWSPIALKQLPFRSILIGSRNDPWCSFDRAKYFASNWGSEFVDYGECGHMIEKYGYGDWDEGEIVFRKFSKIKNRS